MARDITTDETILRSPNVEVKPNEIDNIIKELEESLATSPRRGIGLAAPQIGINMRAAIIRIKSDDLNVSLDLINPVIEDRLGPFTHNDEGCLSIPGQTFDVRRYEEILVKDYIHPAGIVLTGIEAIAAQHEIDHIECILVKDRTIGKNKVGRNDPCPCGSGIKFKKCHGR